MADNTNPAEAPRPDGDRFRFIVEVDVDVRDRAALLAAALQFNRDLYAQDAPTAALQLLALHIAQGGLDETGQPRQPDGTIPGVRLMAGIAQVQFPADNEYPAYEGMSMPVNPTGL